MRPALPPRFPQPKRSAFTDLATTDDLRALDVSLRGELGELRGDMAGLEGRLIKPVAGIALGDMTASAGIAAAIASAIAA